MNEYSTWFEVQVKYNDRWATVEDHDTREDAERRMAYLAGYGLTVEGVPADTYRVKRVHGLDADE